MDGTSIHKHLMNTALIYGAHGIGILQHRGNPYEPDIKVL